MLSKNHFIRRYAITFILAMIMLAATTPAASAATVAGALSSSIFAETNIQETTTPLTITLKGATWNPSAFSDSSNAGKSLMKGFTTTSEPEKWKLIQSAKVTAVLLDSATILITIPQVSAYDIVRDQEISVTIPKSFMVGTSADLYIGTFVIKADRPPYTIGLDEAIRTGTLAYWLSYTSPYNVFVNVPVLHVDTITVSQQALGNTYVTIVDVVTDNSVESVSVGWNNITHELGKYISSGSSRTFTVGFADLPPGADITISVKDRYGTPVQKDIVKKVKTGKTVYKELPKSPLDGWYTLYSLINDSKLLDSILSYYTLSELKAGAY